MPALIAYLFGLLVASIAPAGTASASYLLKSDRAGFTIQFPTEPEFTDKTPAGGTALYEWIVSQENGALTVGFIEIVGLEQAERAGIGLDQLYVGSINAFVDTAPGTLVQRRPIQQQGREGREALIALRARDGVMRMRFFIVGAR